MNNILINLPTVIPLIIVGWGGVVGGVNPFARRGEGVVGEGGALNIVILSSRKIKSSSSNSEIGKFLQITAPPPLRGPKCNGFEYFEG